MDQGSDTPRMEAKLKCRPSDLKSKLAAFVVLVEIRGLENLLTAIDLKSDRNICHNNMVRTETLLSPVQNLISL
jgi:hypothetical protein